ncbi:MAG TPA: hypothetical protein VK964_13055 [Nocardioidaceae bacterium]|nr:hypothetical protein [Nocardioidaceae bacterium]
MFTSPSHPRRGLRRRSGAAVAALTAAAVVSGLATAPVASSAPSSACPEPFPVAEVAKGQEVTGLTVTSGTEPEGFTGEVLGVIKHPFGVAGRDVVMARLSSPEIDRVGVWSGMSGSPVYAADGRLIGAVALGLSWGPSPIAGITPAEDMYRLRSLPGSGVATPPEETVEIPPTLRQRLVSAGVLARAEAEAGLSPLPVPLGISGMAGPRRLRQLEKALDLSGVRVHRTGAVTSSDTPVPVVAGGNVAASLSYGDVSAVGVGTATAVCGEEVLAFGHPMVLSGPSSMTMHGADALVIHEDPVSAGFKLANATAPVGGFTQDRWAGIFGIQNEPSVPPTTDVTSYVDVLGEASYTGTTKISVPDYVPGIAASHLLADQDGVFESFGGGSALVGWTINGLRADGRPWRVVRTDRFATRSDVSFEPYMDFYDQLSQLQFNEAEDIEIARIRTTSTMTRQYRAYSISKVRVRMAGRWRDLRPNQPLFLRGGTTKRFRVLLTSPQLGPTRVHVNLVVPKRIGRKSGMLEIAGGNSYYGGEEFFEGPMFGGSSPATFDDVLRSIRRMPRNDQVLANLMLFTRTGDVIERSGRTGTRAVVNGGVMVEVQGIG